MSPRPDNAGRREWWLPPSLRGGARENADRLAGVLPGRDTGRQRHEEERGRLLSRVEQALSRSTSAGEFEHHAARLGLTVEPIKSMGREQRLKDYRVRREGAQDREGNVQWTRLSDLGHSMRQVAEQLDRQRAGQEARQHAQARDARGAERSTGRPGTRDDGAQQQQRAAAEARARERAERARASERDQGLEY